MMTRHSDEVTCNVVILNSKHCHSFLLECDLFLQCACDTVECFDLECLIDKISSEVTSLRCVTHLLEQFSEIAQIL